MKGWTVCNMRMCVGQARRLAAKFRALGGKTTTEGSLENPSELNLVGCTGGQQENPAANGCTGGTSAVLTAARYVNF